MAHYILQCMHPDCKKVYEDDEDFRTMCDGELKGEHGPAFLQALYEKDRIDVHPEFPGIFQFVDWLPSGNSYLKADTSFLGRPFSYKSEGLAERLKLKNLYIAFSGYWPEKGPNLHTRSFKEFEAQATIARFLSIYRNKPCSPFIISSAGNTANGFNLICHLLDMKLYLVVPEVGLEKLVLPVKTAPYVISVRGFYEDAIAIAEKISRVIGLKSESGARNVARRAGMGTIMTNAVAHPKQGTGLLFDHYFHPVGSGTGAIAVWEAVKLLQKDGRYGSARTKIHMSQNHPFTPIVDSWEKGTREYLVADEEIARERIAGVTAQVLTNRKAPYSIMGGLYDVLTESGGMTWRVNNYYLFHAARMFREAEGMDIEPAAAVAVDSLRQAVESGAVRTNDSVLLHITGGGPDIRYSKESCYPVVPQITVDPGDWEEALTGIGKPEPITETGRHIVDY
ncbi:MAG: cysteate synthase [Spirochaetes bacterium]|nr:cysteate synthase [Spirochaetota bacterium]